MSPGERLYLRDRDPTDPVVLRHRKRYSRAIGAMRSHCRQYVPHPVTDYQVLDCACGSGYGTEMIARALPDAVVYGVDRSQDAIEYAQRQHDRPGVVWMVEDIVGAERWLEYIGWPMDAVVCIETLEHLSVDQQREWLTVVASALRPGGVLVLCTPIGTGPSETNPHHLYEPSTWELDEWLKYAGFHDVRLSLEAYNSTSGPATQATVIARIP